MKTVLMIIAFILCSIIVYSQSTQELIDSINVTIERQDFQNANIWAEKALVQTENQFGKNDTNYISIVRKLVEINFSMQKFDKALEYAKLDSERTQAVYGEKNLTYAEALLNQAQIYVSLQKLNEAENLAIKSSIIYKNLLSQIDPKYADALKVLAMIYDNENKGVEASQTYYKILQSIKENYGIMHESYAETVTNLSQALESKDMYRDSEEFIIKIMQEYKEANGIKSKNYAYACLDLGRLYAKMGRELESEGIMKFGLQMLIPLIGENNQIIMNNYYILAHNYSLTNKYSESEALYKKIISYQKLSTGENSVGYAQLINNLAMLYRTMNRFKEGEELCKKSIDILKNLKMEKSYLYSVHLNSLAEIYLNTGRYDLCLPLYVECENISKTLHGDNYPDKDVLINNRAELYKNMGRYNESEILFQNALLLLEKKSGKLNSRYAWFLNNLAEVLEFEGYYDYADSMYKDVLALRKVFRGEYHPEYAETVGFLARLNEKKGDFVKADVYFLKALEIYLRNINLTFPSLSESEKSYFYGPMKSFFEHFCSYVSKRGKTNPALISELYNYRINTKSLLYNSAKKVRENIIKSSDSSLVQKYYQWLILRDVLARYFNLSKETLSKKGINIDSLNNVANEIEKEISLKSEEFSNEYEKKDYDWKDIKNVLKDKEAAVEIIRFRIFGDTKNSYNPSVMIPGFLDSVVYAALIIKKDTKLNPIMVLLKNGNQIENYFSLQYSNNIQQLRDAIKNGTEENSKVNSEKILADVYDAIWKDINSQLKNIQTVYLSLDGVYNKINLNTVINPGTNHFVIDEKDIRVVTNTSDIVELKSEKSLSQNTAELFGNPQYNLEPDSLKEIASLYNTSKTREMYDLSSEADSMLRSGITSLPGTEKEVNQISETLKGKAWDVKDFLGPNALEEAVKSIRSPRVLHLATHGKFLKDVDIDRKRTSGLQTRHFAENPLLRSFLLFAGAESINKNANDIQSVHDGFLTAYEAMNLNLDSTELVVLSACETGLGEIRNGEGVYGLQKAFQAAGAKTIIMSLWSVLDEPTQELMALFYAHWLSGKTKRVAFREAQLKLKEKYNNIYYWGGFIMVGE